MAIAHSWGRLQACEHQPVFLADLDSAKSQILAETSGLAYGMGRSYGDVCLNPGGTLWHTRGMDRFISFDAGSGVLECEAGVLLRDIQRLMIPRGWMLPVVPGTELITVGGAIANDVHGKNHHVNGSFGHHVRALTLVRTDGETLKCSASRHPEYLAATIGGLGLTGLITKAVIQLRPVKGPWLEAEHIPFDDLG